MAEGGAGLIERGGARAKGENIVGVNYISVCYMFCQWMKCTLKMICTEMHTCWTMWALSGEVWTPAKLHFIGNTDK